MLSNVTKKVMRMWCYETLTMAKPVAGSLCLQCFNFHGKCFSLKAGIPEFSKMIEISCLQVMKSKLTTILNAWHALQIQLSVVCTCYGRGVSKKTFWCGCCSLWIFVAKKATKGTELQFLCTKTPSKVEE